MAAALTFPRFESRIFPGRVGISAAMAILTLPGLTSATLAQTLTSLQAADKHPFVGSLQTNANKSRPKPEKNA